MQKILFIENELLNDNPMSTCYVNKCNRIKNINADENNLFFVSYYDLGNDNIDINLSDYQIALFGCRSIYLYKVYKGKQKLILKNKFENIVNNIKKRFFIIQDMHQKTYGSIEELCNLLNMYEFNIIFTFYENSEAKLIRRLTPNCKYFHLPHHIDTNIFRICDEDEDKDKDKDNTKFFENKNIDILLFGSAHPKHYPFRKRLFDLILNNKDKFNVYFIPYDSGVFNPAHCENGLSTLLNKSKISIGTKSRYDYLVGKYFEIASSGCVIAGDIPTDGKNLLKNNILELNNKMSDDEIINKLLNCCNNYNEYYNTICNFKNIVDDNYNLDKYIDKLISILSS